MLRVAICIVVTATLALAACSRREERTPVAGPPIAVGNGVGSQFGNYASRALGDTLGASGERCVVFDWDRPITQDLAVRQRAVACESKDHPGRMVSRELFRAVIPMSDSLLKEE